MNHYIRRLAEPAGRFTNASVIGVSNPRFPHCTGAATDWRADVGPNTESVAAGLQAGEPLPPTFSSARQPSSASILQTPKHTNAATNNAKAPRMIEAIGRAIS